MGSKEEVETVKSARPEAEAEDATLVLSPEKVKGCL